MFSRSMTAASSSPLAVSKAMSVALLARGVSRSGRGRVVMSASGSRCLSVQSAQTAHVASGQTSGPVRGIVTSAMRHAPAPSSSGPAAGSFSAGESLFAGASKAPSSSSEDLAEGGLLPGTGIRVFRTVAGLRDWRRQQLLAGRTVGLVPTMGALHAGHLELAEAAALDNDDVVVSIYVNPTQFGVNEDLGSYPRTCVADCGVLAELNERLAQRTSTGTVAAVFAPTTPEMYPSGRPGQELDAPGSFVTITPVGSVLEGASRPTFFRGVATVCMKLFHIVQPERAYFGQKDVQQTVVIRRMVKDFCINLQIVVCPTVREEPGELALSSRNVYLGPRRRAVAPVLRRALVAAQAEAQSSTATGESVLAAAHRVADETLVGQKALAPQERALFEIDYLSLADPDTMLEIGGPIDWKRGVILSGAVRMLPVESPQPGEDLGHSGGPMVRLIDNIILEPTK